MTTALNPTRLTTELRRAADRPTLASSVHNTQPWRYELQPNALSVVADRTRQLRVLDPSGRQLLISCGCAVFNARVALAAAGRTVRVQRNPDPTRSDLLARITAVDTDRRRDPIAALDGVVDLRRTNRRRFADDAVPAEVVHALESAANAEDCELFPVCRTEHRLAVARLSQQADAIQNADPAYRAELRAWTTTDAGRTDGVAATAVPHVTGQAQDEVPIRDFDTSGMGGLPAETRSSHDQCLLVLGSRGDDPASWLRAGEALQRVLLEVTRQGFAASPMTQIVEVPAVRAQLRSELGLHFAPHVLLRIGRAPLTAATRRRRLVDVLTEPQ